jgi:hypothetical protein
LNYLFPNRFLWNRQVDIIKEMINFFIDDHEEWCSEYERIEIKDKFLSYVSRCILQWNISKEELVWYIKQL